MPPHEYDFVKEGTILKRLMDEKRLEEFVSIG
jgi:hypothetical protein